MPSYLAVVLPVLLLPVAACSEAASVDARSLATEVAAGYDASDDVTAVDCSGTLEGDVGATQTCRVSFSSGLRQPVTAEVTAVEGDHVAYDTTRGDRLIAGATVAAVAIEYLENRGREATDITCDDLALRLQATAPCTATLDGVPDTSMKSMLFTLDEATDAYYVVILKG